MTRNSESQLPKRAFTKLINHSIEVGSTRKKLENQMHTYLDELRDALEERRREPLTQTQLASSQRGVACRGRRRR